MQRQKEAILIEALLKPDSILFFDMDGTLVDTDYANYLSYSKAIKSILAVDTDIIYKPFDRFNRAWLKLTVPNLTDNEYEKIIQQKEECYNEYLPQTKINESVVDILTQYHKSNNTVLVTNCRENRALSTLEYHALTDKFNHIFCRQINDKGHRVNKYKYAISHLNLLAHMVIVFENEEQEIADAIEAGIIRNNIIKL